MDGGTIALIIMIVGYTWYLIDQLREAIYDWKHNVEYISGSWIMTPTGQVFLMSMFLLMGFIAILKNLFEAS